MSSLSMPLTTVIAEIGVNHDGDIDQAMKLIDCAADAGADIAKFQSFSADRLVHRDAPKARYQQKQDQSGSQYDMLKRLELSEQDHRDLIEKCRQRGIEFLSTGFDEDTLAMLVSLGISRIKIPSGELTNLPYLRAAASHGLPLIISTGMATMREVRDAVEAVLNSGAEREKLCLLHCTSNYPAADDELNLRAMLTLGEAFSVRVGYSDHSVGITASMVAASMGATIIEKHLTLDRNLPGPDHAASIEPDEMTSLVEFIRRKDIMLGSEEKKPSEAEMEIALVARKSIVARRAIRAGEPFDTSNLTVKRPGNGLSPMLWDMIINTVAHRDYQPDEMIEREGNDDE